MRLRLLILTVIGAAAVAVRAQAPTLPPDINPVTLSRFGPVTPADLDEDGQKILAARTTPPNPGPGPAPPAPTARRPPRARADRSCARRSERADLSARQPHLPARRPDHGTRHRSAPVVGARTGRVAGRARAVRNRCRQVQRPVDGLAEKDATLIRFFRALLREHKASSDLFAKMIATYGKQRTVEMMELAGDYWTVGTMMNAAINICRRHGRHSCRRCRRWRGRGRTVLPREHPDHDEADLESSERKRADYELFADKKRFHRPLASGPVRGNGHASRENWLKCCHTATSG